MDIERFRSYCLEKPGVEECFPFDESTLVFKVLGKMFALCALEKDPLSINLKCDPELAEELREQYPEVTPGYHMNKKHWNTILLTGAIHEHLWCEWIDHSYDCVVASMPKKHRDVLVDLKSGQ